MSAFKKFPCALGKQVSLRERLEKWSQPPSYPVSTIVAPLEGLAPEIMEGFDLSDTKQYFISASFYVMHARGLQEQLIGLQYKSLFCSLGSSAFTHSFQKYVYEIGRWAYYNHAFIYLCGGKIATLTVLPSHLPCITFCLSCGIQSLRLDISRLIYGFNCIIISLPNLRQII